MSLTNSEVKARMRLAGATWQCQVIDEPLYLENAFHKFVSDKPSSVCGELGFRGKLTDDEISVALEFLFNLYPDRKSLVIELKHTFSYDSKTVKQLTDTHLWECILEEASGRDEMSFLNGDPIHACLLELGLRGDRIIIKNLNSRLFKLLTRILNARKRF